MSHEVIDHVFKVRPTDQTILSFVRGEEPMIVPRMAAFVFKVILVQFDTDGFNDVILCVLSQIDIAILV